jgi:hypothetical protein
MGVKRNSRMRAGQSFVTFIDDKRRLTGEDILEMKARRIGAHNICEGGTSSFAGLSTQMGKRCSICRTGLVYGLARASRRANVGDLPKPAEGHSHSI